METMFFLLSSTALAYICKGVDDIKSDNQTLKGRVSRIEDFLYRRQKRWSDVGESHPPSQLE